MSNFYWDEVQKIAKSHHIQDPLDNVETFTRFLQFWWCRQYNRPLKDPLLKAYTLEELTYEWLRHIYLQPEQDPRKELEKKESTEEEDAWIRAQLEKVKQTVEKPKVQEPDAKKENPPPIPDLPDISTDFE